MRLTAFGLWRWSEDEQVVELGHDQGVFQFRSDSPQHDPLVSVGGVPLDHDQRAKPGRIDLARRAKIDHKLTSALGHLVEQCARLPTKRFTRRESKRFGGLQHPAG